MNFTVPGGKAVAPLASSKPGAWRLLPGIIGIDGSVVAATSHERNAPCGPCACTNRELRDLGPFALPHPLPKSPEPQEPSRCHQGAQRSSKNSAHPVLMMAHVLLSGLASPASRASMTSGNPRDALTEEAKRSTGRDQNIASERARERERDFMERRPIWCHGDHRNIMECGPSHRGVRDGILAKQLPGTERACPSKGAPPGPPSKAPRGGPD